MGDGDRGKGRKSPFDHLIYPLPEDAGLGIHATNDLGGQVRFGPDVEWIPEVNYTVDPGRSASFESAIRKWWPRLVAGSLQPAYSGIRPKVVEQGMGAADFMVQGMHEHGVRGMVNMYGIESPGLTASLSIASYVHKLLDSQ